MKREDFIDAFSKKTYIGDSVYAHFDGYHIILETINGLLDDPSNRIALEPQVMHTLYQYQKSILEAAKEIE